MLPIQMLFSSIRLHNYDPSDRKRARKARFERDQSRIIRNVQNVFQALILHIGKRS